MSKWICAQMLKRSMAWCSLLVRGLVLGEEDATDKALQRVSSSLSDGTVVHLVVRHTAKVKYSVQGSNFELSISASDTAETVKRYVAIELLTAHSEAFSCPVIPNRLLQNRHQIVLLR